MRKSVGFVILTIVIFLGTLLWQAPASMFSVLGLGKDKVSYSQIDGTIWRGKISNLVLHDIDLGQVDYKLSVLPLLMGLAEFDLSLKGGVITGSGQVKIGHKMLTIEQGKFRTILAGITKNRIFGLPVSGVADLDIETLRLVQNRCDEAEATVWTDMLKAPAKQFRGEGFTMQGPVHCAGDRLLVQLQGGGQEGEAELEFSLGPGLTYTMQVTAKAQHAEVHDALLFLGFEDDNDVLTYGVSGDLRHAPKVAS